MAMKVLFRTIFFCAVILIHSFSVNGQQKIQAYQLYTAKGKKISIEKMIKSLAKSDVILFGELHNDPIAHWLQLQVAQALLREGELSLGAEMFEADNQIPLNQYLTGEIDDKGLDSLARLWSNYSTDYKPLVDFAKENNLSFIATNVPRRYASMVYKQGPESLEKLTEQEKNWMAPLPFPYDAELPSYKAMLEMMGGHGGENFPKAQAIKDATMAHFILQEIQKNGNRFLHFNGAYHSNNYEGIYWYLEQYNADLKVKEELKTTTITTVLQEHVHQLFEENKEVADFILVVDEEMTTTY